MKRDQQAPEPFEKPRGGHLRAQGFHQFLALVLTASAVGFLLWGAASCGADTTKGARSEPCSEEEGCDSGFVCVDGLCVPESDDCDEDCSARDGWYGVGTEAYGCCEQERVCECLDEELRQYACVASACTYTVRDSRILTEGCVTCPDGQPCTEGSCDEPGLPSWNLPSTISVAAGGHEPVRKYAVGADDWAIEVLGLVAGLTYDATLERIAAAADAEGASGTATFKLLKAGRADMTASTTVALTVPVSADNIIYHAHFNDGTFKSFRTPHSDNISDDNPDLRFWGVPPYGRPQQYGGQNPLHVGNGDLMWLTAETTSGLYRAGPRRGNNPHALGMLVKSTAGGSVQATSPSDGSGTVGDCDGDCSNNRRRTELRTWDTPMNQALVRTYVTHWFSASIYIPSDWNDGGGGWGPTLWQWKQQHQASATSPPFAITYEGGKWHIRVRQHPDWSPTYRPDWEWGFYFNEEYPDYSPSTLPHDPWEDGLKFFPDVAASRVALANSNKGGWTDFIARSNFDGRTVAEGGQGFLDVWMRAQKDGDAPAPWTHVLHMFASTTERGSYTQESANGPLHHGVMYKSGEAAQSGNPEDGSVWGFACSSYMHNDQVLGLPAPGRIIYYDNLKIANDDGNLEDIFRQMSPDGSAP